MESIEEHGKSSRLVLVAIDESEESVNALHWALNNVLTSQDRIILIHAQRPPNSLFAARRPGFMVPADVLKTFENDVKKSTEKILAEATEICKAKNLTVETEAYTGDAREVICNAAQTYNPDMLVIGSHGYGALKRVVLGSVSDYCVHYVQCPVVVVKPRMIKTQ
eukprot:PITA_00147